MTLITFIKHLQSQTVKILDNDIYMRIIVALAGLLVASIFIWIAMPHLSWHDTFPFSDPWMRIDVILILFLMWFLKFLLFDLEAPSPFQYKDPQIQRKLKQLKRNFVDTVFFLKKTVIKTQGQSLHLHQLPWYLLIGPAGAGKTTLLHNGNLNFILQPKYKNRANAIGCDWWISKEATIIEVAGKYACTMQSSVQVKPLLWRFLLRLIKQERKRRGINGLLITFPLPEIMQLAEPKKYQHLLRDFFQRLYELQKLFPAPLPCYLIITKCDLLNGFKAFFSEATLDEIGQAWGVQLSGKTEKLTDHFTEQFNLLIKKLNQQLLWRLHHERNAKLKPLIKDFPLQVERLKEMIADFIKKLTQATEPCLWLQGVYLTSAAQPETTDAHPTNDALQLFNPGEERTRPYFVKQFLHEALKALHPKYLGSIRSTRLSHKLAYALSFLLIITLAITFGVDFKRGVSEAHLMQAQLNTYQITIQEDHDPLQHIIKATLLLDTLLEAKKSIHPAFNLSTLFSFYSTQSQYKKNQLYPESLSQILLPEVKYYLEEYLKNPINKESESIYATLKTYLMLGNAEVLQNDYILKTIKNILPEVMDKWLSAHFLEHFSAALNTHQPMILNQHLIQETRQFLTALPHLQLAYIILRNNNNNNTPTLLNLGTTPQNEPVLVTREMSTAIPNMFTAHYYSNIMFEETIRATNEALLGNWTLGNAHQFISVSENNLLEQLRMNYVNNYINLWEQLLDDLQLVRPKNIAQLTRMIAAIVSNDSPLLKLLQTFHDNTYFDPIAPYSPKLQAMSALVDQKSESLPLLYDIFACMKDLHHYLQAILTAENESKAAYEAVSRRIRNNTPPDALMKLRMIAEKSPEPLKNWLNKIANYTWQFLMQDASNYIDTALQGKMPPYPTEMTPLAENNHLA